VPAREERGQAPFLTLELIGIEIAELIESLSFFI
jgi:hypothetical protein